ncbi:MAG: SLBB domain-containing protein, partial [Gemmatimonadota bacterium]|nr:SLBB domain-containing protein [Gemmatimonadota bacterium]
LCAIVGLTPRSARAQDPVQQEVLRLTGQEVSEEEILSRLAQSGLSRTEVRSRLSTMGINPNIADAYFDRIDGSSTDPLIQDADFLQALAQMGILADTTLIAPADTTADDLLMDRLAPRPEELPDSILTVFGRNVFSGVTTQFQPVTVGPVDPDYRLGPGDQLQLILTGDVELAYTPDVTREGFIVIPDVGQVFVNGLTLGDLTDRLYARLGAVYSGVRRGGDATTTFHVSLGRLRINQVFLVGDVSLPGAYQVSSVATVFNALYSAGGPGERGSVRSVEVQRSGQMVGDLDLYDYLIRGDASDDIRLEQGDLLFVPLAGPQVSIEGFVRRPAIYELKPGEQLRDLLEFAGGPRPEAYLRRIQIDRILPPEDRTPERERVLLDVDLEVMSNDEDFELLDGDHVSILSVGETVSNLVVVEGHVEKPGILELAPNMTLGDAITRAGGLLPDAFDLVAHLIRLEASDSTYVLERVSLDADGQPVPDVTLRELDRVIIYGRSELRTEAFVSVGGEVKDPGVFPFNPGMTAEDLILTAGGFTARADPYTAQLVRRTGGLLLGETVAESRDIVFDSSLPSALDMLFENGVPENGSEGAIPARTIELQDGDRVFVRRLQGLRDEGDVIVSGEVLYPGPYALERRGETVSSLIQRAGGLTTDANIDGARLVREEIPLGLNLESALRSSELLQTEDDLILFPGDSLNVPQYDGTVLIIGAVEFQSRTRWREGMDLDDYLDQAGGVIEGGDRGRVSVTYANQERQRTNKTLLWRSDPPVEPGSTISVPFKPESDAGFNTDAMLTRLMSIATIMVAILQISR